jgi:hypothetical protein
LERIKVERIKGIGMNGVGSGRSLRCEASSGGRFIPRRKFAIISRASSLRLFFIGNSCFGLLNFSRFDIQLKRLPQKLRITNCASSLIPAMLLCIRWPVSIVRVVNSNLSSLTRNPTL